MRIVPGPPSPPITHTHYSTYPPLHSAPSRSPKSLERAWYPHACAFLQRYYGHAPVGGSTTLLYFLEPSSQITTTTCSTALPLPLCPFGLHGKTSGYSPFQSDRNLALQCNFARPMLFHALLSVTGYDVLGICTLDPAFTWLYTYACTLLCSMCNTVPIFLEIAIKPTPRFRRELDVRLCKSDQRILTAGGAFFLDGQDRDSKFALVLVVRALRSHPKWTTHQGYSRGSLENRAASEPKAYQQAQSTRVK
ncbi:hypothetical protein GGP41_005077 [Bipolaris sorokiniana]|uniref:Uncharacterized protein n=1 Tax=Cochliobolus sativus TaxID=45130 RepID=A0A8H6DX07_COCSA|nr:hypothetical protein GGP41_005077 [Bipolaris sorokiniana]